MERHWEAKNPAAEAQKKQAALAALRHVKDGMVVGLGTGSTAVYFIEGLGSLVAREGLDVSCVPTSYDTKHLAFKCGLRVTELDATDHVDIAVDGADAVNEKLHSIKGAGGALVREKVVAYFATDFTIIVDESKLKPLAGIVPIEVTPFAYSTVKRQLKDEGINALARTGTGKYGPLISDNGNYILDAKMEVKDPVRMEQHLNCIPGVVANGIFTKCTRVIAGTSKGIKVLGKK
ncbi:ribose-5-phosphate isomerase RpiA [Candidatus Parvarchaeota archaeon]|nr:ribose-5-phosphate isomerase RpiA [Candidatus Parvarchaeota archaeon]